MSKLNSAQKRKITNAIKNISQGGKFQTIRRGKDICLVKMIDKRPVTIVLSYTDEGLWVQPPTQNYTCSISHFDFVESESRFTRRKSLIIQLVNILRETKLWDFVLNKSFFKVNKLNKKANSDALKNQYNEIFRS